MKALPQIVLRENIVFGNVAIDLCINRKNNIDCSVIFCRIQVCYIKLVVERIIIFLVNNCFIASMRRGDFFMISRWCKNRK